MRERDSLYGHEESRDRTRGDADQRSGHEALEHHSRGAAVAAAALARVLGHAADLTADDASGEQARPGAPKKPIQEKGIVTDRNDVAGTRSTLPSSVQAAVPCSSSVSDWTRFVATRSAPSASATRSWTVRPSHQPFRVARSSSETGRVTR